MGETEIAPPANDDRPPLGSWPRIYTLTIAAAILCMALLYWFTRAFNVPVGNG